MDLRGGHFEAKGKDSEKGKGKEGKDNAK